MTDVCSNRSRSTRHSTCTPVLLVIDLVCVLTQQGSTGLGVQELMTRLAE
jgi:hypothetical protein